MDILLDQHTVIPLLIGAALALIGGIVTQLIFWRLSLRHAQRAMLTAFRAELRIIRGNMGSAIAGYRDSLRNNDSPSPTVFVFPTPVFDANAGQLGQLRNTDLVEHLVEVYSSLQALAEQAMYYQHIENAAISLRDHNAVHHLATSTHVQVMKLHNRLTNIPSDGKINLDNIEFESREFLTSYSELLHAGKPDAIFSHRWHDA